MTRSLQAKLLILGVFVIGALTGAVLTEVYETRLGPSVGSDEDDAEQADTNRGPNVPRFEDFLELDEGQRAELNTILRRSRERYRELQSQTRPLYQALTEQSRDEIRAILNDEQLLRYERWIERIEEIQSQNRSRGRER